MCKKFIDAPIVPFTAVTIGSPFSILKVESFNKRTLLCRCIESQILFRVHHSNKKFAPQTNDYVLVQRKGIGTSHESGKLMDYGPENLWRNGKGYIPVMDSSEFTYEMQNELEEVAS